MGWLDDLVDDAQAAAREASGAIADRLETWWHGDIPPPPPGLTPEEEEELRERLIETGADPGVAGRVREAAESVSESVREAGGGVLDRVERLGRWAIIAAAVVAALVVVAVALWAWGQARTAAAVAPVLADALGGPR